MHTLAIRTQGQLKAYLATLFGQPLNFVETGSDSLLALVEGTTAPLLARLQAHTGEHGWSGEPSFYYYSNEELDVGLGISGAQGCVMVDCRILSRNRRKLAGLRP